MAQIKKYGLRVTAAVFACVLWSWAFVFIKMGLEFMSPLQFAGWRFLISGILLIPWVLYYFRYNNKNDLPSSLLREVPRLFALGNLQIGVKYACFYWGVSLLPAALSALLSGTSPLVVALIAHFATHDDKLGIRKLFALLLGSFGVLFLSFNLDGLGAVAEWALLGILLLLLTNLFTAIGDLWVVRKAKRLPIPLITCASLLSGGIVLLVVGWVWEGVDSMPVAPTFYGALFALCVISSVAFALWFWVLRDPAVKVSRLHVWKFLIPLLGALTAWVLLPEEYPTRNAVIGMLFIVIALLILFWQKKR